MKAIEILHLFSDEIEKEYKDAADFYDCKSDMDVKLYGHTYTIDYETKAGVTTCVFSELRRTCSNKGIWEWEEVKISPRLKTFIETAFCQMIELRKDEVEEEEEEEAKQC